jgi:MFS transporter, Spinster family, sphingosine-1-phosphate transporter
MKRAYFALSVLCVINLVNYLDRYILAGVMPHLQKTFGLNNAQGGQLATIFMVVYMCASPIGGFLGDRMPRRLLIGVAVIVWSLATIGSGLAASFGLLLVARALTGVGEAGYGTVAPAVLSDLFKREQRSSILSIFYTAMPFGAALGFVIGGAMAENVSWQSAFFAGGLPGLALGAFAFFMPEPERGAMDEVPATSPDPAPALALCAIHTGTPATGTCTRCGHFLCAACTAGALCSACREFAPPMRKAPKVAFRAGLSELAGNGRYWIVVAGLTLMTFSVGGLSIWMPSYLSTERGFSSTEAGLALGATTVIGGLVGTLLGGFLGDRLERRIAGGGVLLSGIGLILAAPFMVGAVLLHDRVALLACLLLAQFFIFLNNGPLNAAIVNVVSPTLRAFAFGISMLILHLLGDAASPTVIGWISDQSSLGTAILLNAVPVALGGLVLLPALPLFRKAQLQPAPSSSVA